jgi:hypothetical protein
MFIRRDGLYTTQRTQLQLQMCVCKATLQSWIPLITGIWQNAVFILWSRVRKGYKTRTKPNIKLRFNIARGVRWSTARKTRVQDSIRAVYSRVSARMS